MFQFLIGRLATKEEIRKWLEKQLFQFLIGRLATAVNPVGLASAVIVSIPYR